jgi:hypothetical protein
MTDHAGTFNGLSFGAGTDYLIRRLGFYRRAVDLFVPDLPRYHGGLIGASYSTPRTIEADFLVLGDTEDDLVSKLDAFYAAFEPMVDEESAFIWGLPGQMDRRILCRPFDASSPLTVETWAGRPRAQVSVMLLASDPAIYDDTLTEATLTPFTSASGFTWDAVWPINWGAGGSGGGVTIVLGGTWETWPTFTVNGPSSGTMTNPRIEYVTGGMALELTANGGVSMTSGQVLIVESHPARRSVAFSTGASRYGKLSAASQFFALQPGSNELRFRASGDTSGATVEVDVRAARI